MSLFITIKYPCVIVYYQSSIDTLKTVSRLIHAQAQHKTRGSDNTTERKFQDRCSKHFLFNHSWTILNETGHSGSLDQN